MLTCGSEHLELVELHDLVIIVLECEDGAIDGGVSADDHPVFSADSKNRVHIINQFFLLLAITKKSKQIKETSLNLRAKRELIIDFSFEIKLPH